MALPEICIRRPVFATVLSLMLLLLGIVSYDRLTVREYPNIDEPVVSVATSYPGASAQIIETQITQILEGSIAGIENIDILESTSRAETSRITVRFNLRANPEESANDVRDRVSRVRSRLPDEVDEPVIRKVEADAQPIINLVFRNQNMNALQITDYVDRYVLDRLKNLTGVADVVIYGERRYAMRIWIDREGSPHITLPSRTSRMRCDRRMSSCRRAALRASTVSSPFCRALACGRRSSSAAYVLRLQAAIRCGCARWPASSSARRTSGGSAAIMAARPSMSVSSSRRSPIRSTCRMRSARCCRRSINRSPRA